MNALEIGLLGVAKLLSVIVLFLNGVKGRCNLANFVLDALGGRRLVGGLEEGVAFDDGLGAIIEPRGRG